jgi:hypothetical protein
MHPISSNHRARAAQALADERPATDDEITNALAAVLGIMPYLRGAEILACRARAGRYVPRIVRRLLDIDTQATALRKGIAAVLTLADTGNPLSGDDIRRVLAGAGATGIQPQTADGYTKLAAAVQRTR